MNLSINGLEVLLPGLVAAVVPLPLTVSFSHRKHLPQLVGACLSSPLPAQHWRYRAFQ